MKKIPFIALVLFLALGCGEIPFIALVLFLALGCGGTKTDSGTFDREYELTGTLYDTDIVGSYPYIGTIDSLVFVLLGNVPEQFGRVYSIGNGMKEIASFGSVGRGPGEFSNATEITSVYDDKFTITNLNYYQIATMQIVADSGKVRVEELERLSFGQLESEGLGYEARDVSRLDERHHVGVAYKSAEEVFVLYDEKMNPLGFFGDSPVKDKVKNLSRRSRSQLYGILRVNEGRFIHALRDLPYVQFYESDKNSPFPRKKWEAWYGEPYYQVVDGDILYSRTKTVGKTNHAYLGNKYVYILYLDIPIGEYDISRPETGFANTVLVYDHDGRKVARLNLDHRMYCFCVDQEENKLYGLTTTPEDRIVSFDLPDF